MGQPWENQASVPKLGEIESPGIIPKLRMILREHVGKPSLNRLDMLLEGPAAMS